jgi:hypothetical protein
LSGINKTRFLAGALTPNGKNGKTGIAFYKMSNDPIQSPLMYVTHSEDKENYIKSQFEKVDRSIGVNDQLVEANGFIYVCFYA